MGWSLRLGLTRGRYRTTLNRWSHVFSDMPTLAQRGTKASSQPAFSMPPISIAPFQPNSFSIFMTCCFAADSVIHEITFPALDSVAAIHGLVAEFVPFTHVVAGKLRSASL